MNHTETMVRYSSGDLTDLTTFQYNKSPRNSDSLVQVDRTGFGITSSYPLWDNPQYWDGTQFRPRDIQLLWARSTFTRWIFHTLNPFTVTTTIRLHDNDRGKTIVLSGLGVVSIITIEKCRQDYSQ